VLVDHNDSHPGQPIRPDCGDQIGDTRIAIALTVCQDTPSSAAIAEIVVGSIINRRNTYFPRGLHGIEENERP
jgi:hypothetical protein